MKMLTKTTITSRVALISVLGCLLTFGIFFFMLKGCNGIVDMSNILHPYISEEELKSTEPIEVDPFPEPSLERLVAQLKSELGLTEAEIAATAQMIAEERFLDNLNYMDSRIDANTRQAEFDRRKRLVIAKPELLWTPGFILPPTLDVMELKSLYGFGKNYLYDYEQKHDDLKGSKSHDERIEKLWERSQNDEITELELWRGWAEILSEKNGSFTLTKVLYRSGGTGSAASKVGMEYAALAIRENPDSFEAHHLWVLCNRMYYSGTDEDKVIAGYRQLVQRFPNSSIANFELGVILRRTDPATALGYLKRAIQLDDRIDPYIEQLATCYENLGEHEKALAVYQGMSEVYYGHGGGLVPFIYQVQEAVSKLRQQQGE